MGQGTSKYRKITRTPQTGENAGKNLVCYCRERP